MDSIVYIILFVVIVIDKWIVMLLFNNMCLFDFLLICCNRNFFIEVLKLVSFLFFIIEIFSNLLGIEGVVFVVFRGGVLF